MVEFLLAEDSACTRSSQFRAAGAIFPGISPMLIEGGAKSRAEHTAHCFDGRLTTLAAGRHYQDAAQALGSCRLRAGH